jgi:Na+/proline symporter
LPLYYRENLTSIYTYLQRRFGEVGYKTGAGYFIVSRIVGASFRLFLVAGVLHLAIFEPFHFPYWLTVAVTILLIFTYTSKSGIKTVVYTDVFQTTFLVLAVVLTIYFICSEMNLDASGLIRTLVDDPNTQIFHWGWKGGNVFWKQFIGGAFIALVMTGLDQDMMQNNLSISNLKKAQRNIYVQMGMFLVINLIFLSLGALLYAYIKHINWQIFPLLSTDQIFPLLALTKGSTVIAVFFILGLVAAAYSSADSALTALTTSFCVDFLGFERTKPTHLKTRRLVHLSFAFILFITILVFNKMNNRAVIDNLFKAAGYTYGPLLGLFFFGILTKRLVVDKMIFLISLFSIGCTWVYHHFMPIWVEGFKPGFELILLNGSITFLLLWLWSKNKLTNKRIEV